MCAIEPDYDPCQVFTERPVIARKLHKCSECCGPIEPGRMYIKHFSVFDGDSNSAKICEACGDAWREFSDAHGGYRRAPPSLDPVLTDCIYDGDEESDRVWKPMLDAMWERAESYRAMVAP